MTGTVPEYAVGETGMIKEPLSVDPFQAQKLDGMSRVNFDKVYTVEHNVKVKNIGKVSDKSMPKLTGYWKIHKA
jgi:mRNA-degrading endonuclease toxin of MazEF toxin-antitoxin module